MRTRRTRSALFVLVGLSAFGCTLFRDTASVIVEVPDIPESLEHVVQGATYDVVVDTETVSGNVQPESRAGITVPAGKPVSIRAYMRVPDIPVRLKPAATVLRPSNMDRDIALTFDEGVAATIIARVERAGLPATAVNMQRLVDEIGERAGERQWDIDVEAVVDALVADEMHARLLEPADGVGVVVEPVTGTWVRLDPLRPDKHVADAEQRLVLPELTAGSHLYRNTESSQLLTVSVSADGDAGWILTP